MLCSLTKRVLLILETSGSASRCCRQCASCLKFPKIKGASTHLLSYLSTTRLLAILTGDSTILRSAALGEVVETPWLVSVFMPSIVLHLQLTIYCDAPGYKLHTYKIEELAYDREKKKQLSGHILQEFCQQSPGNKVINPF